MSLALRLPRNIAGRDFVIGDIHGEFDKVSELIAKVGFDANVDRLISVGDLVDRGPDSDQCLDWLARPWFHAVMGNHELMALAHACGDNDDAALHVMNGGDWMAALEPDVKQEYARAFARMPLAIEIDTPRGAVGVVHADVPPGMPWNVLMAELDADDRAQANWLLWSRSRIEAAADNEHTPDVAGIHRVYVGHTPVKAAMSIGNVSFVDTGAVFGGSMCLIGAASGQVAAVLR